MVTPEEKVATEQNSWWNIRNAPWAAKIVGEQPGKHKAGQRYRDLVVKEKHNNLIKNHLDHFIALFSNATSLKKKKKRTFLFILSNLGLFDHIRCLYKIVNIKNITIIADSEPESPKRSRCAAQSTKWKTMWLLCPTYMEAIAQSKDQTPISTKNQKWHQLCVSILQGSSRFQFIRIYYIQTGNDTLKPNQLKLPVYTSISNK